LPKNYGIYNYIRINDFIYGAVSGAAQTVIGYPFDSYKVLKQSNMQTTKLTYKTLTSGMRFPLISSTVICGVNFGSYRLLRENVYGPCEAGFISGLINTPIVFMSA